MTHPNTRKKIELIDFLIENVKEPVLSPTDSLNVDDDDFFDAHKICFAILNYAFVNTSVNNNFETFGKVIQNYVPKRFADIRYNRQSGIINNSKEYHDAIDRFQEWICSMKAKIENFIAEEYYTNGRYKNLEILKRRYKQNWSESRVVDLNADQNVKVEGDNKITLTIKDA